MLRWILFLLIVLSLLTIIGFNVTARQIIVGPTGRLQYISTGTASGSSGASYPDWVIDGSFTGVNAKGDNPLYFKSLQIDGDLYILNIYTESE